MRKVWRINPLHPDEAVGKVDAGECKAGGGYALYRAG